MDLPGGEDLYPPAPRDMRLMLETAAKALWQDTCRPSVHETTGHRAQAKRNTPAFRLLARRVLDSGRKKGGDERSVGRVALPDSDAKTDRLPRGSTWTGLPSFRAVEIPAQAVRFPMGAGSA